MGMSKQASLVVGSTEQVTEDLEDDVDTSTRMPDSSASVTLGSQSSWCFEETARNKRRKAHSKLKLQVAFKGLSLLWPAVACRRLPPPAINAAGIVTSKPLNNLSVA